jgi:hypothetical protein
MGMKLWCDAHYFCGPSFLILGTEELRCDWSFMWLAKPTGLGRHMSRQQAHEGFQAGHI